MMMKKITALSLVACAMLVVSVRESQAEEWPDVLDNGCSYTPSPEWTKFGDWCHSESGKSDHHDPDREDCKDFGGTSEPAWCIATPAGSVEEEDCGSADEGHAELGEWIEAHNELRAYTDCLEEHSRRTRSDVGCLKGACETVGERIVRACQDDAYAESVGLYK